MHHPQECGRIMSCDLMALTMDCMTTTPGQKKNRALFGTTFFGVNRSLLPATHAGLAARRRCRAATWIVAASLGVVASGTLSASAARMRSAARLSAMRS